MIKEFEHEIRIALTLSESMLMLNALKVLGRKAREQSLNDDESEWYRDNWQEYVDSILPLYTSMSNQILQHEKDFEKKEA